MRLSISAKPKEKNISYNYSDKHSELCLVNAFCVTVFVEGEIPYIFPTLCKNWVNWTFLITQPNKQSHFRLPLILDSKISKARKGQKAI